MLVSDLRHFLDLPDDAPGPAVKLAARLGDVVRAATAGEAGRVWPSALPCSRRPARRPCSGHLAVYRTEVPAAIHWRCTSCGDDGVISGWENTYFDLRQPGAKPSRGGKATIAVTDEVAAALRDLRLLDTDCERLVYRAQALDGGVVLFATADDLDELIGYVAAEANHQSNRRRQQRLDLAFGVLSDALRALDA